MSKPNHTHVRLPKHVKERLDRLSVELTYSYENGHTKKCNFTEQGHRGCWIPIHEVITRALDEFEAHRERSRRKKRKK